MQRDAHGDEHQELPRAADVTVSRLHRDRAPPGSTTLLADAVRDMSRPGGRPHVFGGGGSRAMTAVRRHLRDTDGLPRQAVSLVACRRHADHPADDG